MKALSKAIVLTGIAGAVIAGWVAMDGEEELAEVGAPIVTAGETRSTPAPVKQESLDAHAYERGDDAQTVMHVATDALPESAQVNVVLDEAAPVHEGTGLRQPSDQEQRGATFGSFEERGSTITTPVARTTRDASANDEFDYSKIQVLYVLKGDEGYLYATFPTFLRYRALIVEKMASAEESDVDFTRMIYEIRAVGIGEETTIFIGDSWMDDGERAAELSEEELNWLHGVYDSRSSEDPMDRQAIERAVRFHLEEQRDPAWRPAP